jgi:hypothetical protein
MMEAARTSETSVDIRLRTWQHIPEDSELYMKCFLSIMFRHYLLGVSYNNSYTLSGSNLSLEQQELIEHSYMFSN